MKRVVSREWTGNKGRLKVSHSLQKASSLVRVAKAPKVGSFRKNAFVVLFADRGTRSGRVRAGSGRRVGPPARPRTTRTVARRVVPERERIEVRVCRVARCAPRRPPDTPPKVGGGGESRVSERWRASASARRKRGKRTLYAPGLGRLHLAGGPVGSGGAEMTGRGQLRVAKRAPRGVARPMRGCRHRVMMADVKREARGCRIDARASHATRPVPRTHLEVTETLPATRAADMVMADMFVWGCGRVAARSARWNASRTRALSLFIDKKNLRSPSRRSRTERRVIKPPTRRSET